MATMYADLGIARLSVEQRLALIEEIWDSLPESAERVEGIPEHHRAEIELRYTEALANPGIGRPWREVLASLGSGS